MKTWPKVRLGDVLEVRGGKRMPAGTALVESKTDHPYLRIVDFRPGAIDDSQLLYVPNEVFPKISRYIIEKGDIFISIVGTIGLVGRIPDHLDCANLTENAARLFNFSECVDAGFIMYFLISEEGQLRIDSMSVGSTQKKLALFRIKDIEIPLPPLAEQREIATILSALDDKIELNRRMSATLEDMARSLYRSWFVDFDPVHAKMEGRQPAFMDEATAALFPDRFGDDGLPEGWVIQPVSEFVDVRIGKTPPRKEPHHFTTYREGIPWLSIKDMGNCGIFTQETSEAIVPDSIKSCRVATAPAGTIFLSFKMTVGRVAIASEFMTTNEAIAHMNIKEESGVTQGFLFFALKSFDFGSLSSTSSIANAVNSKSIRDIQILLPSDMVIEAFDKKASVILEKLKNLTQQNQKLSSLRDSLLPKLMSGEIRVGEAREQIEEVA
jgi:type I restriction enzyme, S subunit